MEHKGTVYFFPAPDRPVKKYTVPLCSMSSSSVIQRLFQQRRVQL